MPVPNSNLKLLTRRHAAWLSGDPDGVAERDMRVISAVSAEVPKMGEMSAAEFIERAGVAYLGRIDPFCRKMLALSRENGLRLTDEGWQ